MLQALVNLTGIPVHELFDVIGGSSTGGILAIAFGACKLSPEAAHDMYVSLTSKIFQRQGLSRVLPDVMLYAIGHTVFSNAALEEVRRHRMCLSLPLFLSFSLSQSLCLCRRRCQQRGRQAGPPPPPAFHLPVCPCY